MNDGSKPGTISSRGMNRREMVQRLASAMGAGLAIPGVAEAHPVHQQMQNAGAMERAEEKAASENWSPEFFDPHQNQTFIVLAERILPGSADAGVNRFVDLLLSVDLPETQKKFVNSLSAFEAYSLKTYGRPFLNLTEDQQNQVLTYASTTQAAGPLPRKRRHAGLTMPGKTHPEEVPLTLRDHFENLKQWVAGAYFSSEPGMKSLGWTGQVMWTSFPGCQHSGGHS